MAGKNVINEFTGGGGSGSVTGSALWGAPSDGSRTNVATLYAGSYPIPGNDYGYGIYLNQLNGMDPDTIQTASTTDNDGTPLTVTRIGYSFQKDKDYLTFYNDDLYEGNCLKIDVKKNCWLVIEGSAVLTGPGGVPTQSTGIGILRNNGTSWYQPAIGGSTWTNEPAANGCVLPISSTQYYTAGTTLKFAVFTTHQVNIRNNDPGSGTMDLQTYFSVTRISDPGVSAASSSSSSANTATSISLAAIGTNSNQNAATLNGRVLNLEPASAAFGGVVTTAAQQFAGTKTFTADIIGQKTLALPATVDDTTGVVNIGGTRIHDYSQYDGVKNFFAGYDAGNYSGTHSYNTAIGTTAGSALTTGGSNVIISHGTSSVSSGQYNTLVSGGGNISTGSRNLCIGGYVPGFNYTGAESDNVCISNAGVASESNTIRIGSPANQTSCYISGITNNTGLSGQPVIVTGSGQLGKGAYAVTALGTAGATPNTSGASLAGATLTLQPADASNPGILSTTTQTIGGDKTFSGAITTGNTLNTTSATQPDLQLSTGSTKNRKIVMFGNISDNQYYGFGVNGNTLRYQSLSATDDHVFFSGVNSSTSSECARIKGTGGIVLPTSGGTGSALNYYESTTFASTFTAGTTVTPSLTIRIERIGNLVTMRIPAATGTFTSAGTFGNQTGLPTRFWPAGGSFVGPIIVRDNGGEQAGRISVGGNNITIGVGASGGNFTAGTIGWTSNLLVQWLVI